MLEKEPDKILLYGEGCHGKTVTAMTSLINLPEDAKVVMLLTERNAASGLKVGLKIHNITPKPGQLYYFYPKRKDKAFTNMNRANNLFARQSKETSLQGDKKDTYNKETYTFFYNICNSLEMLKAVDYATGEIVNLGHVADFSSNDLLIVDGLSVLMTELWNMVMGDKGLVSQSDYGVAQSKALALMQNFQAIYCNVLILAHEKILYKEVKIPGKPSEFTEDKRIPNTGNIGTANYSQILGCFTDVLHQNFDGRNYFLDNRNTSYDIRIRNLNVLASTDRKLEANLTKWGYFK